MQAAKTCTLNSHLRSTSHQIVLHHRLNLHSAWSLHRYAQHPLLGVVQKRNAYVKHIETLCPQEKRLLMPTKNKMKERAALPETTSWKTSACYMPGNTCNTCDKYMQQLRVQHDIKASESGPFTHDAQHGDISDDGLDFMLSGISKAPTELQQDLISIWEVFHPQLRLWHDDFNSSGME